MHTPERAILYILITTVAIVGGIIIYFLYSMMYQFHRYRKWQHRINRDKIEALENERRMIAADIHDDIGPLLTATLFRLSDINPVTDREKELLSKSAEHVESAYIRLRDLSTMLTPSSIERKGPLHALEEFCETYAGINDLKVQVSPVSCRNISGKKSLHLFRMLQEILHNAVRHSKAKHLTIIGEMQSDKLVISTEDDGIGFDVHGIKEHAGLGLQNLGMRARIIGASLFTESFPGTGTRYRIELPLN